MFGEMVGLGEGLVALQVLSTIKKGTGSLNFQWNELLFKSFGQRMTISKFSKQPSDAFQKNTRFFGGGESTQLITFN